MSLTLGLLVLVYGWGWRSLRRMAPPGIALWRLSAFLGGMAALWLAVGSPLAHLDQGQLTVHMTQHLLIMTVAAPLLLLGEPVLTGLHCVPARTRTRLLGPRSVAARTASLGLLSPPLCWLCGTLVVIVWHVPAVFELGMRWHAFQHASFLAGGLFFWVPVIQPWPSLARWPRWSIPPYLFLATLPCDALSAFLAFCGRVIYSQYCSGHVQSGGSALDDQARAGALMWLWVTLAYLVPAALVTFELLSPSTKGSPGASGGLEIERHPTA